MVNSNSIHASTQPAASEPIKEEKPSEPAPQSNDMVINVNKIMALKKKRFAGKTKSNNQIFWMKGFDVFKNTIKK